MRARREGTRLAAYGFHIIRPRAAVPKHAALNGVQQLPAHSVGRQQRDAAVDVTLGDRIHPIPPKVSGANMQSGINISAVHNMGANGIRRKRQSVFGHTAIVVFGLYCAIK